MEKDTHKTKVIFRQYKDGGQILALFPEIDEGNYNCSCYERVGQHGSARYSDCISITKPAKAEDYSSLKKELEGLGYNLDVKKKHIRK